MNKIIDIFQKLIFLSYESKIKYIGLALLFLSLSILDVISIGLIYPYISLISSESSSFDNFFLNYLYLFPIFKDFTNVIIFISVSLVVILLIKTFYSLFIIKIISQFSYKKGEKLRILLINKLQNLEYEKFLQKDSSEYILKIQNLSIQYAKGALLPLLRLLSDLMILISVLVFLLFLNFTITSIFIILLVIFLFFFNILFKNRIISNGKLINIFNQNLIKSIEDSINGFKEIRIYNKESFFKNKITKNSSDYTKTSVENKLILSLPKYLIELIIFSAAITVVLFSILTNRFDDNLLSVLGVFAFSAIRLIPCANTLISNLNEIRYSRDTIHQLYDELKDLQLSKINNLSRSNEITNEPHKFKSLICENISFKYPNDNNYLFQNLNISVNRGDVIGISGKSGSGKTTLANILLTLLSSNSGRILFNNKNVFDDLDNYRNNIAYVSQESFIFDDSIRNNVAFLQNSNNYSFDKEILRVLKSSNLDHFIENNEKGLDYQLGHKGNKISGGQRQRLSIARALFYKRDLIILDEFTSSLDQYNEQKILNEIKSMKKIATFIIISHNEKVLKICNKIIKI